MSAVSRASGGGGEHDGGLPAHETRETESEAVGAGVMGAGGTAVDRGTGELGGRAQEIDTDRHAAEDDADANPASVAGFATGGARPTIPPVLERDDREADRGDG